MKKRKFLVPLLLLLAYFVIGAITTGCSSQYTCPTYSNVYNIKNQSPKKQKMMANYYHTKKFRY